MPQNKAPKVIIGMRNSGSYVPLFHVVIFLVIKSPSHGPAMLLITPPINAGGQI